MMTETLLIISALGACVAFGAGGGMREGAEWTDASKAGAAVDLAPWTYAWRADLKAQPRPEAEFIPRRLERQDRIYRTAKDVLPPDQLKSIYYNMPDLLQRLPPKPAGALRTGLLWTGGLNDFAVELRWPESSPAPVVRDVEVRSYPTSFGWFGFTVDRVLGPPTVSADGRVWTYRSDPSELMDSSYSVRVPAATEMLAVFCAAGAPSAVPQLRLTSANVGAWKRTDVEIEWGFEGGSRTAQFGGRLEPSVALLGPIAPLEGDDGTLITTPGHWKSMPGSGARRGIQLPLLYAPDARAGLDSRVTIRTRGGGVTFSVKDLDKGPIYIPTHGLFITRAGSGVTAAEFIRDRAAAAPKSLRHMTREHREAASWDELMQQVLLWTCPPGATAAPFPAVSGSPMKVELSDERWSQAWRSAANQLTGEHMWGGLAFEVARVTHAMEMIGLHPQAEKVYNHFLDHLGAKPDGDYSDGKGALEHAASLRHDMGYSHDGTHASTGRLLYSIAERCLMLDDREWFLRHEARLTAAADWILRQRADYMKQVPNRARLFAAGLLPPCMLGDYAIPSCDWHWYYVDNALAVQGIQRFADALARFGRPASRTYLKEAAAFRKDVLRAAAEDAILSPVRRGRDGAYHTYLPRMAYARGMTGPELGAPQFPDTDMWMGALPLAEPLAVMDASDPRVVGTSDIMEDMGTSPAAVKAAEEARRFRGLATEDAWFWHSYSILPKASHTANAYLLQDDVPSFLRYWMNQYAAMVGADGKLWEHAHLGGYDVCASPDNGTAGWFLENFRNALVMEEGEALWIARGTPRAWLEAGRRIAVADAPTVFGPLSYTIEAGPSANSIRASLKLPQRTPGASVTLRLRHPKAAPMRSVTVNGKRWTRFDPKREIIRLPFLKGETEVVAEY
ncbi:MAG: hypothetical protein NT029_06455 [Armatimonadetes bacterium]|nr:hypothetical protein [Armatimonadota bacterium]